MPAELPAVKKLSKHLQLRVTKDMHAQLRHIAKEKGIKINEFVRATLQKKLGKK